MFSSECFIADILKRMKDDATLDPETMQYYWITKLPNAYGHFFFSVVATILCFRLPMLYIISGVCFTLFIHIFPRQAVLINVTMAETIWLIWKLIRTEMTQQTTSTHKHTNHPCTVILLYPNKKSHLF